MNNKEYLCCQKCGETQMDSEINDAYIRNFPGEKIGDIPYTCDACRKKDIEIKKAMITCLFQQR